MLIVIFLLGLSSWTVVGLFRRLRRQRANQFYWLWFLVLLAGGTGLGIWCAFFCEYPVGAKYRWASFPIPVVFFHLEEGQWVDYPVPTFQAWSAAITNIITIVALMELPLWFALWFSHRKVS
jgi:hypothetical protein